MQDTIKYGKKIVPLKPGDKIMDNGSCYQLITHEIMRGFSCYSPRISKAEFKKFIALSSVSINKNHRYGDSVTIYTYQPETTKQNAIKQYPNG